MNDWKMITFSGADQKGIVAAVTRVLEQNQFNLGETSMIRLAGNFTMMIMAQSNESKSVNDEILKMLFAKVLQTYSLCMHIDDIAKHTIENQPPNINIAIHGADRVGIVADVTEQLHKLDFNIVDLYTDMGGEAEHAFYILNIEGNSDYASEVLENKLQEKLGDTIKVMVSSIDLLIA